ncbi:MAG: TonB-dependent receptor plug domain-containing protein [Vulcanimicrobiaceae bacterium]
MISRIFTRALCAAIFVVSSAGIARAQTLPPASPSPSPIPEIAHVITSDRSDETLKNAARTTFVITREQIVRYGYRNVADAVVTLPGVNLVRYGATGSAASFGIRGSSSEQVLVLINGMPASGSQINNVDLDSLPTTGVERIEVVEGGGSTLYGSGSIGGIVNVITTPMASKPTVNVFGGSFATSGVSLESRNVSFSRLLARNDFGLPADSADPTRPNSDSEQSAARVSFDRQLGSIGASFTAGIVDDHLGVPGPDGFTSTTSRESSVNQDAQLAFVHSGARATATLQLGGARQQFAYTCDTPIDANCPDSYLGAGTPPYAQLLIESRLGASLRNVVSSDRSRTTYGIDLSHGVARVDDGTDPLEIAGFAQTAAYLQQSWMARTGSRFYAGIRAERDGAQGGEISPSIGGILHLSSNLSLKANAATAFRAPTAEDLYYPGFSNPSLQDERTRVGDASLVDGSLLGGATLTWFTTSGRDLIVLDQNFVPQNIGRAAIQGLTFAIRTLPLHGYYASLNVTDLYRAQDLETGNRIPNRGPVLQNNLELGYLGSADALVSSAAITIRSSGARGPVDFTQPLFDQPAAYSDLGAFVRFRLTRDALLTVRGYNLGNERYAEIAGYPMPGRSVVVELSSH